MARFSLTFAMFFLLSAPVFAQYVAVIQACSRDVTCAPPPAGTGPLVECIKAHFQKLTEPCKGALVRIPEVLKSCGIDIDQQCPTIKPGGGRILICVKEHFAALSEPCKEAIGRAAERKLSAH